MASNQIIGIGFGKANYSNVLMTVAALKVEAPFKRTSAMNSGVQVSGTKGWTPAGLHEMNGGFTRIRVAHENGCVILLQASWMRGGSPIRDGSLFIRLRQGAPHYLVNSRVPTANGNSIGDQVLGFDGMGDILTPDEIRIAGLDVPRWYTGRYMDPEELEECFRIQLVAPETVPRPSLQAIATPEGVQVREVPNLPQRRIRLRR